MTSRQVGGPRERTRPYTTRGRVGASSTRIAAALAAALVPALSLLITCAKPGAAQDTASVAHPDSLAERLRRAEEAIELLREQLATQAESNVQSASRTRVELFGRVLMNAFSNSGAVNNADVPLFALPSGSEGAGATIRQTSFGLSVMVSEVLGGTFDGELHTDFFGGQQPSSGGRHFPLLRVRTARGILRWSRAEILAGQEVPLVVGLNPESPAAAGTPEFVAAGNLWLWLPQIRVTGELGTPLRLAIQGAVLAPASGDPALPFDTDLDPAERSRRPYLQARLRSRWGSEEAPGEIGVGVHRGWIRRADGTLATSAAVAADAVIPLGSRIEVRAEGYVGQALRGLGGGGIGQNLRTDGGAVEDRGGWAQLIVRPEPRFELAAGCGAADPDDEDLPAGRRRNVACAAHILARPGGPVMVALGYRRHRTTHTDGTATNDHINLAAGFEF
jgi:hypothetical protein